jgi:hypothetical protein
VERILATLLMLLVLELIKTLESNTILLEIHGELHGEKTDTLRLQLLKELTESVEYKKEQQFTHLFKELIVNK